MIDIFTYNIGTGVVTDSFLLYDLLKNTYNCSVNFNENLKKIEDYNKNSNDVAVWIQNPIFDAMTYFKKNIWIINEEWCNEPYLSQLNRFDYIICKSKYAKSLLDKYNTNNIIYIPFISRNMNDNTVERKSKFLHFNGKSIQKNSQCLLNINSDITIIDNKNCYYELLPNITRIYHYLNSSEIKTLLNTFNYHICPSLYEAWGHYLFEGLSTGAEIICSDIPIFKEMLDPDLVHFIPTQEKTYLTNEFDLGKNNSPLRKSFHVDEMYIKNYIENFKPLGKNDKRKLLFKHINIHNSKLLLDFFDNL